VRNVPRTEVPSLVATCAARAAAIQSGPVATAGPAAVAAHPGAAAAPAPNLMPDGLFKIAPEEDLTLLGIAGIKVRSMPRLAPSALPWCQVGEAFEA